MEIGINTGNFHDSKVHRENRKAFREEGYRRIRAAGFDCADLGALVPPGSAFYTVPLADAIADAEKERKIAEAVGVRIEQVHGPWPTYDTTEENRKQKLILMERAIRLTPVFGTKHLVIHPDLPFGWEEERDPAFTRQTNLEMLDVLLPIAEQEGVIICLENMPTEPYVISRTEQMYHFVRELDHPNLGMCFDTGHAYALGDDCGDMVRLIAPVLKTLHIHDNMGYCDMHLWPYEGTLNWKRFTDGLRDIGFPGVFSLEVVAKEKNMEAETHFESVCRLAKLARELADQVSAPVTDI